MTEDDAPIRHWAVNQKFLLAEGTLDLQAESELYKRGVRREINAGCYRWACYVQETHILVAQGEALILLQRMLGEFGVTVSVFDMKAVAAR